MLPFLNKKRTAAVITTKIHPDGSHTEGPETEENQGLKMAAQDLIDAIHAKDPVAVSKALKAAMELCEDESPEEANDYDSLNELAAEQE